MICSNNPSIDARITQQDILHHLINLKQLIFEVTDDCNLSCSYCGYGEMYNWYDKRETRYMNLSQVKKLIDYLFTLWNSYPNESIKPFTTFSFYGGEPLLNMAFIKDILEYTRSFDLKRQLKYSMTTNAMLLDRCMDFLVDNDFLLLISLDGNMEANSYRVNKEGLSSFERVFKNIHLLQKKYPSFFDTNVNFNAVLHNRNTAEEAVTFIKEHFGKVPQIGELSDQGVAPEKQTIFNQMYQNVSQKIYESENYDELSQALFMEDPFVSQLFWFLQRYSGNMFFTYNDLLLNSQNKKTIPTGTCIPFSKKMFVSVNGKIFPCEKIDHRFYYGHVSQEKLTFDMDDIIKKFNGFLDKIQKECLSCFGKETCKRCIYTLPILDQEVHCPYKETKTSIENQTAFYLKYLAAHPTLYRRLLEEVNIS